MAEEIKGIDFPVVTGFEYNEDETVSANFARLIRETLGLEEPWSTTEVDKVLTFKGTDVCLVHIDVDKDTLTIQRIMYLFYWFMDEYYHLFPGDRRLNVFQILE